MLCFCEITDFNASNSIILKPAVMSNASAGIRINIRVSIMQAIAKKKLMC